MADLTVDTTLLTAADKAEFRRRLAVNLLGKLTGATYASEVLADNPFGYWRLGEASGVTAVDSSGNGRNGLYTNSPTLGVPGLLVGDPDTAATFTVASGADMEVPNSSLSGLGANLATATVEFWIETTTTANRDVFTALDTGSNHTLLEVALNSDENSVATAGSTALVFNDAAGTGFATFAFTDTIYDGAPHHVVWQVAGLAPPAANAWVDGVPVVVAASGSNVNLGAVEDFTSASSLACPPPIDATLDEIALYTTRLSGARVLAHYQAGETRPTPTADGLATDQTAVTDLLSELKDAVKLGTALNESF